MEITWLGHSCFRLKGRDVTVVCDPPAPSTGYKLGRPAADVVTVSHAHPGHSSIESCGGTPRLIEGPGEYEVGGVLIAGVQTFHDAKRGAERGKNTAFIIEFEELRICHLGDLGHVPTAEQTEQLSGIDILMTPVGGGSTIDAAAAAEVVSLLEPKYVIPMHYRTPLTSAPLESLDPFLKEMGAMESKSQTHLMVTRASLPAEAQVIVLEVRK